MRRRALANFNFRDRAAVIEFALQDLQVVRQAYWGDIDGAGQIWKAPDIDKILRIGHKMVALSTAAEKIRETKKKALQKLRETPLTQKGKPRKAYQKWHGQTAGRGDGGDKLDTELVSPEQQKEIDRAKKLNQKEAEDAKNRTAN